MGSLRTPSRRRPERLLLESRRGLRDPRDPRGTGAGPGHRRRSRCRSTRPRPSSRRRSASTRATTTRASRNPTRTALQLCLASLEGAEHGVAFSSGLGATTTIMHLVNPGERVVSRHRRLRRRLPDVLAGLRAEGLRVRLGPGRRAERETRGAPRRAHAHRLARDADEPAAEHGRHPRRGRRGPRGRRARRRRQHVRHAVPAAAARARRRRRPPLDDQVPRRPLRPDRRLRRHQRPDRRRAPLLPAEVARRGAGPVRLVARAARTEDARRPDARSTARTRGRSPSSSTGTRKVETVLYPGLPSHPGHELAAQADARLRRDDLVPRRIGRGGGRDLRAARRSCSSPRASAASRA